MDTKTLREMRQRATAGPWRWWTSNSYRRLSSDATGKDGDVLHGDTHRDGITDVVGREEDRALITAAVNHLDAFVELLEAAKAAVDDEGNPSELAAIWRELRAAISAVEATK